eukprot:TRINITY_DN25608_c0_g1_i2.p1 TRINITY_DN25608_c0_g1~~TRINITY_DN25608_c0_g1_i2.p1  ORF type:complete len:547 (-),score=76.67 TRINITY_DN25608_c0_g1_i2:987-2627(-)
MCNQDAKLEGQTMPQPPAPIDQVGDIVVPENTKVLRSLNVLDTIAEESFDSITRMLADAFDVPISLVTLFDCERQWFKSKIGLLDPQCPPHVAFCAHLLVPDSPEILLVPDLAEDPRFHDNPLVAGPPHMRFYVGAPIILKGHRIGSLCLIDMKPRRDLTRQMAMLLVNFADMIAGLMAREVHHSDRHGLAEHSTFLVELTGGNVFDIKYMNKPAMAEMEREGLLGSASDLMQCLQLDGPLTDFHQGLPFVHTGRFGYSQLPVKVHFHPAERQMMAQNESTSTHIPYARKGPSPIQDDVTKSFWFVILQSANFGLGRQLSNNSSNNSRSSWAPSLPAISADHYVKEINSAEDLHDVQSSSGYGAVLFTSKLCGSCARFYETYCTVASLSQLGSPGMIRFTWIDLDRHSEIAGKVISFPLFLPSVKFFNELGEEVAQWAGSNCREFFATVSSLLSEAGCDELDLVDTTAIEPKASRTEQELEEARSYNQHLQQMLTSSVAEQMKTVQQAAEAEKARVQLLEREQKVRARKRAANYKVPACQSNACRS